jgi:DNA-binding NtrC family response regulator
VLARQDQITVKELPAEVRLPAALQKSGRTLQQQGGGAQSLVDMERNAILDALAQTHGNKKKAAELLGIQRPTLYNKMKRYAIQI